MDYKQFRRRVAERLGRPVADVESLIEGLEIVVTRTLSDMDSVAVPTFGTISPIKHNEQVVTDLASGNRLLLPPEIKIEFTPGAMFLKRLRHE